MGAVLVVASGGTLAAPAASWFLTNAGTAALLGAITGAAGAAANGGSVAKGALIGGVSGAAFFGVGQVFSGAGFFTQTTAHGSVGGLLSELQGGKFGHGFLSAGIAKGFSLGAQAANAGLAGEFMSATLAGGTVSKATGGKFANGASTAALAFLVNQVVASSAQKARAIHFERQRLSSLNPDELGYYIGADLDVENWRQADREEFGRRASLQVDEQLRSIALNAVDSFARDVSGFDPAATSLGVIGTGLGDAGSSAGRVARFITAAGSLAQGAASYLQIGTLRSVAGAPTAAEATFIYECQSKASCQVNIEWKRK